MNEQQIQFMMQFIKDMTGNIIEPSKQYFIESKVTQIIKDKQLSCADELITLLEKPVNEQLRYFVADFFTINETLFFRDTAPFDTLKDAILPELIIKRGASKKLNIWSAASATGQEIYSLAILLEEYFPQLKNWQIKLWATDYSERMLAVAREAKYSDTEIKRGMPEALLHKYFTHQQGSWHLNETIRKKVTFTKMNLLSFGAIFEKYDIILLRNVLIYFDVATKAKILQQIRKYIAADGYLFLGSSETLIKIDAPFVAKNLGKASVYVPGP